MFKQSKKSKWSKRPSKRSRKSTKSTKKPVLLMSALAVAAGGAIGKVFFTKHPNS